MSMVLKLEGREAAFMNEQDRADFALAEAELEEWGEQYEEVGARLELIEELWLDGEGKEAAWKLSEATGFELSLVDARDLLERAYGEVP